MKSMLEELWFGTIDPLERANERRKNQNLLEKLNDDFEKYLQITQTDAFQDYKEKLMDVFGEFEKEAFKDGFKIATRLILESFEKDNSIFDEIM